MIENYKIRNSKIYNEIVRITKTSPPLQYFLLRGIWINYIRKTGAFPRIYPLFSREDVRTNGARHNPRRSRIPQLRSRISQPTPASRNSAPATLLSSLSLRLHSPNPNITISTRSGRDCYVALFRTKHNSATQKHNPAVPWNGGVVLFDRFSCISRYKFSNNPSSISETPGCPDGSPFSVSGRAPGIDSAARPFTRTTEYGVPRNPA